MTLLFAGLMVAALFLGATIRVQRRIQFTRERLDEHLAVLELSTLCLAAQFHPRPRLDVRAWLRSDTEGLRVHKAPGECTCTSMCAHWVSVPAKLPTVGGKQK